MVKKKNTTHRIRKAPIALLMIYLFELFYPATALALTGGPSQPEVEGFTPIDTSDMVNLFTGDFSYNIPLLDVEGYPVNLAYQSGISTDQEASWVGLGWSVNTGVMNRTMRGLPDDFNGDAVVKEFNMKDNISYGVTAGSSLDFEVFGFETLSIGMSLGIKHNNYSGFASSFSITPSLGPGEDGKMLLNVSLGISASSDQGASIQPNLSASFPTKVSSKDGTNLALGISFGGAFNTRSGLSGMSVRGDMKLIKNYYKTKLGKDEQGQGVSVAKSRRAFTSFGGGGSWNFNASSYVPASRMDMKNLGFSGKFGIGLSGIGLYSGGYIQGFKSKNSLKSRSIADQAFGYMNIHKTNSADALLDYNRENEGGFDEYSPAIAYPNFTSDFFNAQAQGCSGNFRAVRNDMGSLYSPRVQGDPDLDVNVEVELGFGVGAHAGGVIGLNRTTSESRNWNSGFGPGYALNFAGTSADPKFEPVYFKEAGETSVDSDWQMFHDNGGLSAVRVELLERSKYVVDAAPRWVHGNTISAIGHTKRNRRQKRTQLFSYLENKLAKNFGVQENEDYETQPVHLIGEITTLGSDGARYVFGQPLYNNTQHEVSFAVGTTLNNGTPVRSHSHNSGLVEYVSNSGVKDNSVDNKLGIDNFYERTILPKYAHSFMLTSILSSDYIDADDERGPSDGDMGGWTKFSYAKVPGYKWRTPLGDKLTESSGTLASDRFVANYMEGLRSKTTDDRASYIYGEKDLAYLEKIETKNYICIFETEDRDDALGVADENGRVASGGPRMKSLKTIHLYSKAEWLENGENPVGLTPIKSVHFNYSYELCKGIPNSTGSEVGKLTLREVYFTYRGSFKAKFSSYKFNYCYSMDGMDFSDEFELQEATSADDNPDYNLKAYDRWGNYKPNNAPDAITTGSMAKNNSEDPFTIQNRAVTDKYVSAWTLKEVMLPSGGAIRITFESDDYAYVQDKKAAELYKIVGSLLTTPLDDTEPLDPGEEYIDISNSSVKNPYIIIQLPRDENDDIIGEPSDYYDPAEGNTVFIKAYTKFEYAGSGSFYEYVPGYYTVQTFEFTEFSGKEYAVAHLTPQRMKDSASPEYNPITISGLQFGRKYFSQELLSGPQDAGNGNFKDILLAIGDAFAAFREFFKNPNQILYDQENARKILRQKSMIRLKNQNGHKLGGGLRVKKIETFDSWNEMTQDNGQTRSYGQVYKYELPDGTSSGVAAYEPQIGGEDNPLKRPLFVVEKRKGIPDDRYFIEEPLGESFFPAPGVGYSRVEVSNLPREGVTRNATGKVVHEFYTAKEFPTIATRTNLENIRHKADPFSIRNLLKFTTKDYSTASQGICVEVNDMHGKPKSQKVYSEMGGDDAIISSVEYIYKKTPYGNGTYRLDNTAKVIYPNGQPQDAIIGLFYEIFNDTQEQSTFSWGADLSGNVDVIVLPFIALPIPTVKPGFNREHTLFRYTSTVKLIQRFGILEKTVARDGGSQVSTSNLAYDSETGQVLLTEVNNNFGDRIYNLNFPAYWKYREMGPAYQNIDFTRTMGFDAQGQFNILNARHFYAEGDELALYTGNGSVNKRGWVTEVGENYIRVIDRDGAPVTGTNLIGRIIRSGYRNMQMGTMANITTKTNPLNLMLSGNYSDVLQASAIEFTNAWQTNCECFTGEEEFTTTNPYVLGIKGYWKPTKSFLHLTDRTQTDRNENSNTRNDGVFGSFNPFYAVDAAGNWNTNYANWTYTSEVTQFSPHGQEIENRDALGRYSAAKFGYRQTLATAVGANTKYSEMGFEGFEYLSTSFCGDNDFDIAIGSGEVVSTDAHTGRYSLKVNTSVPPTVSSYVPSPCAVGDCGFTLEAIPQSSSIVDVFAAGGIPGYNLSWNYILGTPVVQLVEGGQLRITGTSWILQVTATDSNGNTISVEFTNP